ncbi:FecR family protein [Spirosoma luteolum]
MKHWLTYRTADAFATDPAFRAWVAAGQFDQPGHAYTHWLAQHPDSRGLAQDAADLLRSAAVPDEPMTARELTDQIEATWQKVRRAEAERTPTVRPLPRHQNWLWRAAAILLIAGGLGWWVGRPAKPVAQLPARAWLVAANRQTTVEPLSLADGSVVWLYPGSTLRYPVRFAPNRREVILTGEAFFEVHKNPRQPFYVKTSQLTARVVGTSFLVRVLPRQQETVVQVRTGKVLVYPTARTVARERPVSVRANEELRVARSQEPLVAQSTRQPSDLSEQLNEQGFEFNEMPVSVVLTALAKAYRMPLEYDAEAFRHCRITTNLADEPLTEKLTILAETIGNGTRAELVENRIRITGAGCP